MSARQAMIFAAGMGTRLKPITDVMPKALVKVNGKPLLAHIIDNLKRNGYNEVVVNVHHFADMICEYLSSNKNFGINISISDERQQLLETGGGLKHARDLFKQDTPILIHNVDILSNVNLSDFYEKAKGNAATLLVSERKTQRYLLFNDDMRLVGWTNISTGEVKTPYKDLDLSACHKYAFAGIHAFSPTLFQRMESWPERFPIIDFYLDACAKQGIYGYIKSDLRLLDVGKLDTLEAANDFTKELGEE